MRQESDNHIVLSRRNLMSLLHMLDNRDKVRPTIVHGQLYVEAEEDDVHYGDRQAGTMSWEQLSDFAKRENNE